MYAAETRGQPFGCVVESMMGHIMRDSNQRLTGNTCNNVYQDMMAAGLLALR